VTSASVTIFDNAAELPPEWDTATGTGFMTRTMLRLLENINPCSQQYHFASTPSSTSVAVTYHHHLNLFSFARNICSCSISLNITGVPCSVAAPGLTLGSPDSAALLLNHLASRPGLTIALNTTASSLGSGFISGPTLPTFRIPVAWPDFISYLSAMRSTYRRRIQLALSRGCNLKLAVLTDKERFDNSLHALYLNVFRRSGYPLECLPAAFFRRFPGVITVFRDGPAPVGFVQTLRQGDRLIFLFGGLDYSRLKFNDTYLNMLLYIIRTGIESGCREIDLGQTAGTSKLRLGAKMIPLYLHATHPSPIVRWILRRTSRLLSYGIPQETPRVFHN